MLDRVRREVDGWGGHEPKSWPPREEGLVGPGGNGGGRSGGIIVYAHRDRVPEAWAVPDSAVQLCFEAEVRALQVRVPSVATEAAKARSCERTSVPGRTSLHCQGLKRPRMVKASKLAPTILGPPEPFT